jgi:uncharacterized protein (DUF427 family)
MIYQAVWSGTVLAESDDIVELEGNAYFPAESLRQDYFQSSDTTTVCPWKGTAHYLTVTVDGSSNPDAAWTYPKPYPAAEKIRHRVAFWHGVQVRQTR